MLGERLPTMRFLVGLAVTSLLAGCVSGTTSVSSPTPAARAGLAMAVAKPAPTTAPTPSPEATPPPNPTATPTLVPTIGRPADDGARIIAVTTVDVRTRDLAIESPAVGNVSVRLLIPSLFDAKSSVRWPVLYLLCGSGDAYKTWTENTDVEKLTAPTNLLVVMPTATDDKIGAGWYSDWWNGGKGGQPMWETFHLVELRQLLERNWHAGDKRVIAGLSMGGYGAMEYATRQPGMFLAAASFSGPLDPLGSQAFLGGGVLPSAIWGDPLSQPHVWKAHDPTTNAAALNGTALYVAYGNGNMGPLDNGKASPYDPDVLVERDVATESGAFVHQLTALHIPVTVDAYGNGTHTWPYMQRDLRRSLPFLLKAL